MGSGQVDQHQDGTVTSTESHHFEQQDVTILTIKIFKKKKKKKELTTERKNKNHRNDRNHKLLSSSSLYVPWPCLPDPAHTTIVPTKTVQPNSSLSRPPSKPKTGVAPSCDSVRLGRRAPVSWPGDPLRSPVPSLSGLLISLYFQCTSEAPGVPWEQEANDIFHRA